MQGVAAYNGCAVHPMALRVVHGEHLVFGLHPAGGDERQAMHNPDSSWQDAATGASSAMQHVPASRCLQAMSLLRSPLFTAILGAVMALGLLLAFENVVAQAVTQAEQQRNARDAHDAAVWRCKQLRGGGDRGTCLVQLSQARDLATQTR